MKFSKILKRKAEELQSSGVGEHFLRYKDLKKQLKQIQSGAKDVGDDKEIGHAFQSLEDASTNLQTVQEQHIPSQAKSEALTPAELSFIETLKEDLEQFNDFFIEKEEECIIRTQALKELLSKAGGDKSLARLRSAFVDLHGEMVLLLHWSMLNYTAVQKILKKHDKQSGVVLRAPFLASVLQQPFYSTERITGLVHDVEDCLNRLLAEEPDADRKDGAVESSSSVVSSAAQAPLLIRRTQAALDMWQEMGSHASTPSTVLPVTKKPDAEETPQQQQQQQQRASIDREVHVPAEVEA